MREQQSGDRYDVIEERENNIIGRRIAKARHAKHLTLDTFSALLGEYGLSAKRSALSKWETGETTPNAYQLLAICHALDIEDVRDYFSSDPKRFALLNETGVQKLADYKEDLIASGRYRPMSGIERPIRYVDMPVSLLPASAGTGEFLDNGYFETVSFPESSIPVGAEFGVRVSGDSMEPVYHDGQIVWVHRCQNLHPGETGLFLYDGSGYLKVYGEQTPAEGQEPDGKIGSDTQKQPVLISYNQRYAPIPIPADADFRIAGKVLN